MKEKQKPNQRFLVLAVVAMALISACRGPSAAHPRVETRQVTDDLGRVVTVPVRIKRAVSLAPSLTENIFAVGAGDRLVGVTTFCDYPLEAKAITKIGDTLNPNIETIVALKPDIVFVTTASQIEAFTRTLATNGIAVYVTNPDSLDGVFKNLGDFGELFGTGERAKAVVTDLQRRVDQVSEAASRKKHIRVFVQFSKEPLFTAGRQSFLNDVLEKAGCESVTENVESAFPKLSKETAMALQPEAIILSKSDDNREPNDVFENSPAVKNHRIISINADILSRPGPRLVDAMEQIAEGIRK